MSLLTYPALLVFAIALFVLFESLHGQRRICRLDAVTPLDAAEPPCVSVIIPARNEEQHLEAALSAVLALQYPRLEIIVLDDRSTDNTAAILERMAKQESRLRLVTVRELPPGWLGKNHALHVGAEQAQGEFLLFTDADVQMAPDTLSRAVARMLERRLDHICLIFKPAMPNLLLAMLVTDSLAGLLTVFKPWRVSEPNPRYFIGIGGFNLVRRTAYAGFGGHRRIRLCPVDDILLGRLVNESGGRQECLNGSNFVRVPWYGSVAEMARGLRKNIFAVLDYRLDLLLLLSLLIICCNILPFWGLLLAEGWLRLLCGLTVTAMFLSLLTAVRAFSITPDCLRWFLLTPYLKLGIIWQAAFFTLRRGGIDWRDTFYSLDELKQNMVPVLPWSTMKKE